MKVPLKELDALEAAIEDLDALWDFDATRALCDARGGAEYERASLVPALRSLHQRLEKEANQR